MLGAKNKPLVFLSFMFTSLFAKKKSLFKSMSAVKLDPYLFFLTRQSPLPPLLDAENGLQTDL